MSSPLKYKWYTPDEYLDKSILRLLSKVINSSSFAPLLAIIGGIQANEALKLILNLGESIQGKLLLVDALNMEFNEAILTKDPSCPVCN